MRTAPFTAEEQAMIDATREEWLRVGRSTERIDRDEARAAINAVYASIDLPAPEIIWTRSPLETGQLWDQLSGQLRGQLRDRLRDQLSGRLRDRLRDRLRGQLWGQLSGQLWDQLSDRLRDQLSDRLRDQLRDQLSGRLRDQLGGAWESYWLAYYAVGLGLAGLDTTPKLNAMLAPARTCGWWLPTEKVCLVADRPTVLDLDATGRLHSITGPAMAFSDGLEVWALSGIGVPSWMVTDRDRPDYCQRVIADSANTERRRVGLESVGWERVIGDLHLRLVSDSPDPANPGQTLSLYDAGGLPLFDAPVRLLLMTNASPDRDGTLRTFVETVPASIDDALAAAAWQFDVPASKYKALVRAT